MGIELRDGKDADAALMTSRMAGKMMPCALGRRSQRCSGDLNEVLIGHGDCLLPV
jgi:hypothetical protein